MEDYNKAFQEYIKEDVRNDDYYYSNSTNLSEFSKYMMDLNKTYYLNGKEFSSLRKLIIKFWKEHIGNEYFTAYYNEKPNEIEKHMEEMKDLEQTYLKPTLIKIYQDKINLLLKEDF